jgi:hypothetical protein
LIGTLGYVSPEAVLTGEAEKELDVRLQFRHSLAGAPKWEATRNVHTAGRRHRQVGEEAIAKGSNPDIPSSDIVFY